MAKPAGSGEGSASRKPAELTAAPDGQRRDLSGLEVVELGTERGLTNARIVPLQRSHVEQRWAREPKATEQGENRQQVLYRPRGKVLGVS